MPTYALSALSARGYLRLQRVSCVRAASLLLQFPASLPINRAYSKMADTTSKVIPADLSEVNSGKNCMTLCPHLTPMFFVASEEAQKKFHTVSLAKMKESLNTVWSDGHKSTFDYFWLKDNCDCLLCHHPDANERTLDTCSIPDKITPKEMELKSTFLHFVWTGATSDRAKVEHTSSYDPRFLRENCFSPKTQAELDQARLWKAADMRNGNEPTIGYEELMTREDSFFQWLEMIRTYGFSVITGVPNGDDGVGKVAQRISFLRATFWGDSWSVRSEPNPRNLSLTKEELFPHTDFSWSDTPPGLQFLHCVEFKDGGGGEGSLVDGYAVAKHLRHNEPETFRILKDVPIKHYFSSRNESYSCLDTTIKLDEKGLLQCLRFNQANRAPIEADPKLVRSLYRALNTFSQLCRSDNFLLKLRLQEGEMLVFNNHRCLHGRAKYDATNTVRHLKERYLDWDQFQSKYSILNSSRAKFLNAQKLQGPRIGMGAAKEQHQQQHQTRSYSTAAQGGVGGGGGATFDPGYDNFNAEFIWEALKPHQTAINSGLCYPDGSSLKAVVDAGVVSYTALQDGTKADYVYQCALFQRDIEVNLLPRIIGMLRKLEGDHVKLGTAAQVDLFEHSIQTATRALWDGADEEMVVVALLHDIGEMMSPMNHGKVAGAILEPYIAPESLWLLNHHEIFQGYYYFHHVNGDPYTRDMYKDNPNYQLTVDFCHKWDQPSFDPKFESLPVERFEPMLKRVLSRKPYWHFPNHPKLGVFNIQKEGEREESATE